MRNKNAFQWDAYRPLVDRMLECASRGGGGLVLGGPPGGRVCSGGVLSLPGGSPCPRGGRLSLPGGSPCPGGCRLPWGRVCSGGGSPCLGGLPASGGLPAWGVSLPRGVSLPGGFSLPTGQEELTYIVNFLVYFRMPLIFIGFQRDTWLRFSFY